MRILVLILLAIFAINSALADESTKTATEAVSREFGIPIVADHLLLPGYANGGDIQKDARPLKQQNSDILRRWRLYISMYNFLNGPSKYQHSAKMANLVLNDQQKLFALDEFGISGVLERSHGIPNRDDHLESFSIGLRGLNEFDQMRFNDWVRSIAEKTFPSAKHQSVLVNSIGTVRFKKYNFAQRVMPIGTAHFFSLGGLLPVSKLGDARFNVVLLNRAWKPSMRMDPKVAEMIVGATDQRFRSVYLSVRGQLNLYSYKKAGSTNPVPAIDVSSVYMSYDPLGKHPVFAKLTVDEVMRDLIAEKDAKAVAESEKKRRAEEAEIAKSEAANKARLVSFPDRTLDFLGVSLGMPIGRAVEMLKSRMGSDIQIALDTGAPVRLPRHCREVAEAGTGGSTKFKMQADLRRRMSGQSSTAEQLRSDFNANRDALIAQLPNDCKIAMMPIFRVAAQVVKGRGRQRDVFVLYSSGLPGASENVVAISRQMSNKQIDFRVPLEKKYGDVAIKSRYVTTWFETDDMHNYVTVDQQRLDDCIADTPWPIDNQFYPGLFKVNCGRYIASRKNSAYAVDTSYVLSAADQIQKLVVSKSQDEVKIDF
ncbi:MAG: hypothetical protein ABJN26_06075 [Stappiaceae bacterium]